MTKDKGRMIISSNVVSGYVAAKFSQLTGIVGIQVLALLLAVGIVV
jgi:hypothetical protein